jgi:hypothetical protein
MGNVAARLTRSSAFSESSVRSPITANAQEVKGFRSIRSRRDHPTIYDRVKAALRKEGWKEVDLEKRLKGDPVKVKMALQ